MELVVIIIMFMVGFSFLLKLTALPLYGRVAVCLVMALFVAFSWPQAAGQSKTQIAGWLGDPQLMLDMAVLLTVDVFIQISFCIVHARCISGDALSRTDSVLDAVTLWFPGILIFVALFAALVEVLFAMPGVDFPVVAWSLALGVLAVGVSVPSALRWLVPEKDLRLELIFMINAIIAMLGVVATVNGRTAVTGTNSVEWQPLVGFLLVLLLAAFAGFVLFRRKQKKLKS